MYKPRTDHMLLGEAFFTPVKPADFPMTQLRYRNTRWSEKLGLDGLDEAQWLSHFGRFQPLTDNLPQPLALKYHGHQFQHYNPDLGDGRGFLFAQLEDPQTGDLLDLATKGTGRTPFSRGGDGRLTLKGGVREILASAYLEALGVKTSKGFSLVETGESLHRGDEPSPTRSAVLVRLGHSHIRFGTFQRLAFENDADSMRQLVSYCLAKYYDQDALGLNSVEQATLLLKRVTERTAKLVAQWFTAGFVHGVLNTDNMNIAGESFDYGPFRVLPNFEPGLTAAYFDNSGLYAFGRQPEAVAWNLERLAEALLVVVDDKNAARDGFTDAMSGFGDVFQTELIKRFLDRLWVDPTHDTQQALKLVRAMLAYMQAGKVDFEGFFFDIGQLAEPANVWQLEPSTAREEFREFATLYQGFQAKTKSAKATTYYQRDKPVTILYDEIEALWSTIDKQDDWSEFDAKCADIEILRQAMV